MTPEQVRRSAILLTSISEARRLIGRLEIEPLKVTVGVGGSLQSLALGATFYTKLRDDIIEGIDALIDQELRELKSFGVETGDL